MDLKINGFNGAALNLGAENTASAAEDGKFANLARHLEQARENASASQVIDKTSKLYEQCEALESFLIKNLLNSMRATVQKSGFMDGGFAGDMYEDMLYDEYAKDFTKNAKLGFAELAYLELTGQRGSVINEVF